jgi:hypothetical protein
MRASLKGRTMQYNLKAKPQKHTNSLVTSFRVLVPKASFLRKSDFPVHTRNHLYCVPLWHSNLTVSRETLIIFRLLRNAQGLPMRHRGFSREPHEGV